MRDWYARLAVALCVAAAGCASSSGPATAPMSQLEYRNMQTRTFDTDNRELVLKAIMNVLQDLGYVVKGAETELGLITAEKWTDIAHTKKEMKKAEKRSEVLATSQVFECSANVTPMGGQCKVRVNFQRKLMGANGAILGVQTVDDAGFYQQFMAAVDKGIFLQKEGI